MGSRRRSREGRRNSCVKMLFAARMSTRPAVWTGYWDSRTLSSRAARIALAAVLLANDTTLLLVVRDGRRPTTLQRQHNEVLSGLLAR